MNFDAIKFLINMLKVFLECQGAGLRSSPQELVHSEVASFAIRRELRRQARKQGIKGKYRRQFVEENFDDALQLLETNIEKLSVHI